MSIDARDRSYSFYQHTHACHNKHYNLNTDDASVEASRSESWRETFLSVVDFKGFFTNL